MHRFFLLLRPLFRSVVRHPWLVILLAIALSALSLFFAQRLRVDTDLANLLPPDYTSVRALENLRQTVGGESSLSIGIESPSFEANKAYAEALIPLMMSSSLEGREGPMFSRVEYQRDTEFMQNNALYFATTEELDRVRDYLEQKSEDARLEANPFFFDLEDDEAEPDSTADELEAAYDRLVGKEFPVSSDSTVMAIHFFPTASNSDIGSIEKIYAHVEKLVQEIQPERFHSDMKVTVAGRLFRRLSEVKAITNDVARSFGIGVSAVLLLVILYFSYKMYSVRSEGSPSWKLLLSVAVRAPVLGVLIAFPLLMGLAWTFGLATLVLGSLNLMTSTLGLVLFGLGIDFGQHFYARYSEYRATGQSPTEAAESTFESTGQAIAIGGFTTSAGMLVLVAADFRGFSEFGFMAGTGILFALVAMLFVLPAVLVGFENIGLIKLDAGLGSTRSEPEKGGRLPASRWVFAGGMFLVVLAIISFRNVSFEYEFGTLEPTYEEYNHRQDVIGKVVGSAEGRRNPAYVVLDRLEDAPQVIQAVHDIKDRDTETPTIGIVESLQERFPMSEEDQLEKLSRISEIRDLLDDDFLKTDESDGLERLRKASTTRTPILLDDVPEKLKEQFASKTGEIGKYIIIYPSIGLSDARNSIAFSADVGRIETEEGDVYHAASTSLVAADMLSLMMAEAPWIILATLVIVSLLMLVHFRSLRLASLAMLPLVVGVGWMMLAMEMTGMKLNFYNLIVLPAVLGIGNDDGVHIMHRYIEEGFGSLRLVLRSTGEHVLMTTLTTMIGFSGLLFSFHPGLRSIGELAVVGVGATLLASLFFLPATLQILEDLKSRRTA